MEKETTIEECPKYYWRRSNVEDDRYDSIGKINLYMLQSSSGVYDALAKAVPELFNKSYNYFESRQNVLLKVMTRKRYRWQIGCKVEP